MLRRKHDKDIMASEAETMTSFYGILAGLTFTASVLIFSNRASLPYSDIFLTLSLITTIFFIYAAFLTSEASTSLSQGKIDQAWKELDRSIGFGIFGFFLMLSEIAFIAFCVGWQFGVIVTAVIVLGFGYILAKG